MDKKFFIAQKVGRVDRILAETLFKSRNQMEQLIKEGLVSVNGKVVKKGGQKVSVGDTIKYSFKTVKIHNRTSVIDFDVDIIYEDDVMMVVNKPSGLVVHPAPSVRGATLVDWLVSKGISLSNILGKERYGIVHRIDKNTTGALVVAKTNEAHEKLSVQLRNKSMGRYYLAVIDRPLKESCIVERPIGRSRKNRYKMDVVNGGKDAKSAFYKLIQNENNLELIVAKLFTGRTHQIRVHLNSLGRHILGDVLYGFKSKEDTIDRVLLHAYKLYLVHPITGQNMEFVAPLFPDMKNFIYRHFNQGEINEKINPNIIDGYFATIVNRM